MRQKGDLTLSCYTKKAFYAHDWDDVLIHARGHVYDAEDNIVSCPFEKIFNINEVPESSMESILKRAIDEDYSVYEKLNGHLCILFNHDGKWINTTKGSWDHEFIPLDREILDESIVPSIEHYEVSKLWGAAKNFTFLFEIIADYDKHLMFDDYMERYGKNTAVLIGAIHNETGQSLNHDELITIALATGTVTPAIYNHLKITEIDSWFSHIDTEGYVIHFLESDYRVKVKTDWYLKHHYIASLITNGKIKKLFLEYVDDEVVYEKIPEEFHGNYKAILDDYQKHIDKYKCDMTKKLGRLALKNVDEKQLIMSIVGTDDGVDKSALFSLMRQNPIGDRILKKKFIESYDFDLRFPNHGGFQC